MILNLLNNKLANLSAKEIPSADYEQLFLLHQSNTAYNAIFTTEPVNKSRILEDLEKLPPGTDKSQKNYTGIYEGTNLLACLDFVEKYPDASTVYIGLLMVDHKHKNRGIGSLILSALTESARESGYKKMRLACFEENAEGYSFWIRRGFKETERKAVNDYGIGKILIVMETELYMACPNM